MANPCMDFQKSTDFNTDIHDFGWQSSIIHTSVDIHIDTQARISIQGHSAMDIRKELIPINGYPCFYGYQSYYLCFYGYPFGYPWISMDIHAFFCYGSSIQGQEK